MNTGKYGAYKQLTTPNSDISETIIKQEELNLAHQQRKDAKKKAEDDKKRADSKKIADINSGYKTRFLNFEHALTDGITRENGAKSLYAKAASAYNSNPNDSKSLGIMTNIENSIKKIKLIKQTILAYDKALSEGIASGKISKYKNKDFVKRLEMLKKGDIDFSFGEDGNVTINNLGGLDFNKDGEPDIITLEMLTDKNAWANWEGSFDLQAFDKEMEADFGTLHEKNPDGSFKTKETKGYDATNSLLVKDRYRKKLGKTSDSLTLDGKEYLDSVGYDADSITQDEYNTVIDNLEKGFAKRYDKKEFNTTNESARTARINANKPRGGSGEEPKSKDSLRQTVDGIMAGDKRYWSGLVGTKLEEQGSKGEDKYIREVGFENGILKIKIQGGDEEEIREIDVNDPSAPISIAKLIRPNDKFDRLKEEYDKGKSDNNYTKTESDNLQDLSFIDDMSKTMKAQSLIPQLKKLGIKGFKDVSSWYNNKIEMPNGVVVHSDNKKGMDSIKKYIRENYNDLKAEKKSEEPKPEPSNKGKKPRPIPK